MNAISKAKCLSATYIGSSHELKDKTALILPHKEGDRKVKAQFDDTTLPQAFGWHTFLATEFRFHDNGDWPTYCPGQAGKAR